MLSKIMNIHFSFFFYKKMPFEISMFFDNIIELIFDG